MSTDFEILEDYYQNIAIPTLEEFFNDKMSIRRAKLALIVFYHVIDYIVLAKKIKKITVMESCKDISILANAANATKHCVITNYHPKLKQSKQIIQKSYPGFFEAPFGEGTFYEASEVYLSFNDDLDLPPQRVSVLLSEVKKYFDEIIYN